MMNEPHGTVRIEHPDGWYADHEAERFNGPGCVVASGRPRVGCVRNYLDDQELEIAVVTRFRESRRGGMAGVEVSGFLPFGSEPRFSQKCLYAANHVRVTFDAKWRPETRVRRHFGVGTLFFPGEWRRLLCIPPALHLAEGAVEPHWRDLDDSPAAPPMLAHWHRPPLAVVLEDDQGRRAEVGTGSDLWRWEDSLGYGPEGGSYKLLREEDGIRFVREPLMTCEEVTPPVQPYRFTWYAAWGRGRQPDGDRGDTPLPWRPDGDLDPAALAEAAADADRAFDLDFEAAAWPLEWCRAESAPVYIRGDDRRHLCWRHGAVQKRARRAIRQIAAARSGGRLRIRGIAPGPCWDPLHTNRHDPDGLVHWDVSAIMDFAVWTRQTLGADWTVTFEPTGLWRELPSFAGLFGPNGFGQDLP